MTILFAAHPLAHVNASLNALATVLLVIGFIFIKRGRIHAHKNTMITAFGVSAVFLISYVWYHVLVGHVEFGHAGAIYWIYCSILLSHILLAFTVPFLAIRQIYLGYRALGCCCGELPDSERLAAADMYRVKHCQLARITFPVWLYVSVTGVVIYVMLYHLWPPIGE